ncbi:hypothetical protein [Streptomyces sp. NPDC005732]|uniref:hypothetical protein n=1 Tax=Streptomyces sp. NPDC005732 TaxID=3157057 RepID=UPI0033CF9DF1
MIPDQPLHRVADHPWPAAITAAVLLAVIVTLCCIVVRRTSGAVLTAGIGALVCTAYGGDTSWRFAGHRLGMTAVDERAVMFAAGEIALIACAIMARANKQATATRTEAGTPGVPGVLVWLITGVQVIPAFSESGFWAGIVRAVFGPIMGGLLWHLAMGLEIRVSRPTALSTGLPAQIGAELRERLLSYLGLATRNRTAEQISRDRATARAVRLASRRWLTPWGKARLAAAAARSRAASDGAQRQELLQQLAGRRTAAQLRTVDIASPWAGQPGPVPAATHPRPAAAAVSLPAHPAAAAAEFDTAAASAVALTQPHPDAQPGRALLLDLAPMLPPQPDVRAAEPDAPRPEPATARTPVAQLRTPDSDAQLLEQARALNVHSLGEDGKRAPLRLLQSELGIGQRRAQRIQAQLPTTLAAAMAAQPPAKEA